MPFKMAGNQLMLEKNVAFQKRKAKKVDVYEQTSFS